MPISHALWPSRLFLPSLIVLVLTQSTLLIHLSSWYLPDCLYPSSVPTSLTTSLSSSWTLVPLFRVTEFTAKGLLHRYWNQLRERSWNFKPKSSYPLLLELSQRPYKCTPELLHVLRQTVRLDVAHLYLSVVKSSTRVLLSSWLILLNNETIRTSHSFCNYHMGRNYFWEAIISTSLIVRINSEPQFTSPTKV